MFDFFKAKSEKSSKKNKRKVHKGASLKGSFEADNGRFKLVWGIMIFCFGAVFCRLAYVQVFNAEFYQNKGNMLITKTVKQFPYRGMITDRNNMPLAISAPLVTVVFSPYDYAVEYYSLKASEFELNKAKLSETVKKSKERVAKRLQNMDLHRLSALSGIDVEQFQNAVQLNHTIDVTDKEAVKSVLPTGTGSHYFMLMKNVNPEVAKALIDADFAGVNVEHFYQRYYPQPQPNAHILGFMSQSDSKKEGYYQGQAGIEKTFETVLAGKAGEVRVIHDAKNNRLKEIEEVQPEIAGKDIQLTIDSRLQYVLYQELERVGRVQKARWAMGMIVDVHSGEVMALSNWPSFNPNDLNSMNNENQRNHALIDMFEPGSVMKPITVATGLKSGQYTVNSKINTSPGTMNLQGHIIKDHGNLGMISLRQLLQKSSNVASAKIALSLPAKAMSETQRQFGFGQKTNLNFPGESAGLIPTPADSDISRRATVSYGYGLNVTLAQLAQSYAVLGAGGVLHPLTLVKSTKDNNINDANLQNLPVPFAKPASSQIIKKEDALAVVDMMTSVTEEGGTAKLAAIDGYRVAGKTGTARRANPKGGYYKDQYRTAFVGIAPASNPRFVVAIVVEDPQLQKFGGLVAAPVFKNVMKETLRLYNVPFDKPLTGKEVTKVQLESVNDL